LSGAKKGCNMSDGFKSDYLPEYDEMLINHMSEGYSFESFSHLVNKARSTIYLWAETFPSFKEAREIGNGKAKHLFESALLAKIQGKSLRGVDPKLSDTASIIFALKTRFRETYTERLETIGSNEIKITVDREDIAL